MQMSAAARVCEGVADGPRCPCTICYTHNTSYAVCCAVIFAAAAVASSPHPQYDKRLCEYLDEFDTAFLVHADNVGSKQFMDIRRALREMDTPVLMGKNTLIRRCIRLYCERSGNDAWGAVIPHMIGNVGLVFTKKPLTEIRDKIAEFKVGAAARVGVVAPNDVFIPAGGTGLDPSQTSFFQVRTILVLPEICTAVF